jgi:hypothetical protein
MIITDEAWIMLFLSGAKPDYKERTYQDILDCSDKVMEECHDQVQWMFPLHEESNFAMTYPILNATIIEKAKKNSLIVKNIKKAIHRMSDFYGFSTDDREKQRSWCKDMDHNLLRITRIIRCARFFGLDDEATEFYDKAVDASHFFCISNVTRAYWWRAQHEPLYKTLK